MGRTARTASGIVRPRARRESLVVREVGDEVVVYDLPTHQAHCLNAVAAAVWRSCDGRTEPREIARRLSLPPGAPGSEQVVRVALDLLGEARLLEDRPSGPAARPRRVLLGRLGAAAALSLPVVASLLVPEPAAAQSCVPLNQPCSASSQCCPNNQGLGCCRNGRCAQGVGNCAPG
jgi:hypothetical protein